MARPDKLPGFVGDNGNTEEPPNSLKTNGYSLDEVPQSKHHNWLFRKFSEWIAYFQKRGVPDYSSTVEYDTGDVVNDSGVLYISLVDANTGNATSDDTKWALADAASVKKAGDTMTGALTLPGDPENDLEAATKQYVDTAVATVLPGTIAGSASVDSTGSAPTGSITWPNSVRARNVTFLTGAAFGPQDATFQVRRVSTGLYRIRVPAGYTVDDFTIWAGCLSGSGLTASVHATYDGTATDLDINTYNSTPAQADIKWHFIAFHP